MTIDTPGFAKKQDGPISLCSGQRSALTFKPVLKRCFVGDDGALICCDGIASCLPAVSIFDSYLRESCIEHRCVTQPIADLFGYVLPVDYERSVIIGLQPFQIISIDRYQTILLPYRFCSNIDAFWTQMSRPRVHSSHKSNLALVRVLRLEHLPVRLYKMDF